MSILVFAGTSEGRAVAEFLSENALDAVVCVATEYGEMVLPNLPHITVQQGRLTEAQMCARMTADTLVLDATHPYADAVTANIRAACDTVGAEYLRILRPRIETQQSVITVPDTAAAAAYLNQVTGSALLTTGSKELAAFTAVHHFAQRLWVRVLPTASVLAKCTELGFPGARILAMQGPFSAAFNIALLRQTQAKYLVTKDTGAAGGFAEKLQAVRETGVTVILIARPTEETGYTVAQVKTHFVERFHLQRAEQMARFPLFVSLQGKKCVVIGAGRIAARRVEILQRFGAQVTVVAPQARAALEIHHLRGYEKSDLSGAFLVVTATDDRAVNRTVAADCAQQNILCSVADCAQESTFFFPAVCTGGKLTAGVVSDGTAHAATARAAARIRTILNEEGGEIT